uniref:Uncharacterized protein n=1 Tax=Anguilla anguilla TaxID=7936 RepID=A0A0E9VYU1_ANGAN
MSRQVSKKAIRDSKRTFGNQIIFWMFKILYIIYYMLV